MIDVVIVVGAIFGLIAVAIASERARDRRLDRMFEAMRHGPHVWTDEREEARRAG
jgi:hypothetical protein